MKFDKGTVNLMTRSLRQGWNSSSNVTESLVLSLWSGSELDTEALNAIRSNYTWETTGRFQNHWPTALQTPRGSIERARLVLHNFNDRFELKPFTYSFNFSKRSEAFSILAAGSVASFTLMLVGTTWTGYTNAAANEGRLLISGTVGVIGSGADLELSETSLTLSSRIVASAIKMSLSFTNFDNGSWRNEGETAALIDPYWHRISFLANYNNSSNESKSGSTSTVLSGTETYTNSSFGVASKALVCDGTLSLSYPNHALNAKTPGTGDFTYEIWCVPKMNAVTDISSTARAPWGYTTAAASNSSVYVYFNGLARSLRVAIGATTVIAAIPNAFLPNGFCHIAVQRRSGILSLFVDGFRLASVANNTSVNASTLRVGSGDAAANNFIGDIDSIRFTNSARYDREFYLVDREPNYYVDIPSDPDNNSTVCLIDFGIDPTKDLKTNEALIPGTGGTLPTEFDNGYAIFNNVHSVTSDKVGYGLGTVYTVEGIFILDEAHTPQSGIIFGIGIAASEASYFYIYGTTIYFTDGYPFVQNSSNVAEVTQVLLGRPTHVALVFDGTNMRGYVNGRKIFDTPRSRGVPVGSQKIFLGSHSNTLAYQFKGKIKTFRISNSARYTDNFVPDGSFVKYNSFSAPEEVRLPKSDILEATTDGWTLIANAPSGVILSPADWSEALSRMVTGIKVVDRAGRVAFLSKEVLRPTLATEIAKTHRTPDTYQFQTAGDSYIYHHELAGNDGSGLDYSYLFVNRSDGLIWNNSNKFQFNALGQPQLPASIYIH